MVDETCPVCRTAEIVCGKWTLLLVRELSEGRSRFCELERSLVGISPRTLSLRLRALEEEGIVERATFPAVPPRVEYALTDKGMALIPIIEDMRTYGERWLGPLRALPALAARAPRPRGFGLTVTPADFDGARTSRVLRAWRFDLLGVRGSGRVEVRVRARGGPWSAWIPLAAHGDHAPDTGTGERASDPVWTGGSDELQLRLASPPGAPLRVHFVAVPAAARRRAAVATRAHARAAGRDRSA